MLFRISCEEPDKSSSSQNPVLAPSGRSLPLPSQAYVTGEIRYAGHRHNPGCSTRQPFGYPMSLAWRSAMPAPAQLGSRSHTSDNIDFPLTVCAKKNFPPLCTMNFFQSRPPIQAWKTGDCRRATFRILILKPSLRISFLYYITYFSEVLPFYGYPFVLSF